MSLQTVNISLNTNDGVLDNVLLGKIFIDTEKASIDYFDIDGKPQHIILFDNALDTNSFMLKNQYDANNDGVVDNTYLFDNHPSSYYAKSSDLTSKGDMFKLVYDSNDDGVVNDSDKLGGQLPAYYAAKSYVNTLFEKAEADIYEVPDEASQLSLNVNKGDFVKRTDTNITYINNGGTAGDMSDWTDISASGELEKITENGNTGWRLKGRDPNNYGNIGNGAIDFSYSNYSSTTYGATGDYSFAEGFYTKASGRKAHAEGYNSTASGNYGSHAEGYRTTASGYSAHAEGEYTTASGHISHAEGRRTIAGGYYSHAEGYTSTASGASSHAEGRRTIASGNISHAEGNHTIAQNTASHAEGKYNTGTSTNTIHETGIGTSDTDRKNAFEIYIDGTLTAPECTNTLIDSRGAKALVTKEYVDANVGGSELEKITENGKTGWRLKGRDQNNYGDIGNGAIDFSYSNYSSTTYGSTGYYSFAEGYCTTASGYSSHAEGDNTTASGYISHAEGSSTTASGSFGSHAEGDHTEASGDSAHAEGGTTTASGDSAHAEGYRTTASGYSSHAEGEYTTASGYSSHAEGNHTIAQNTASHAEGKYNTGTSTNTIHETGIGTSDTDRKNAFEIYIDGTLTAPECTNTLIDSRGAKALVTKEYVIPKGGATANRPVDPELFTQYFDTDINKLVICTDNTSGSNVWVDALGTTS